MIIDRNSDTCGKPLYEEGCSTKMLRTRDPCNPSSTALIVVDVQPEYWTACPQVRKDFPNFPRRLEDTIDRCRRQGVAVIWIRADYRHKHSPWLVQFSNIRGSRNLVEVPFEPKAANFCGWETFATPKDDEAVFGKPSWCGTNNTPLLKILRKSKIDTVLVCGLITSVCVQHTAFGLFQAGYRTLVVEDACADRGRKRHEAALFLYGDYMYEVVSSDDLKEHDDPEEIITTISDLDSISDVYVTTSDDDSIESTSMMDTDSTTMSPSDCILHKKDENRSRNARNNDRTTAAQWWKEVTEGDRLGSVLMIPQIKSVFPSIGSV